MERQRQLEKEEKERKKQEIKERLSEKERKGD